MTTLDPDKMKEMDDILKKALDEDAKHHGLDENSFGFCSHNKQREINIKIMNVLDHLVINSSNWSKRLNEDWSELYTLVYGENDT